MSEWRKALEAKFPYHRPELGPNCVYCGNDAHRGRDHVPPLCVVSRFPVRRTDRVLYPCCPRCNLALMDFPETCLIVRLEVIIDALIETITVDEMRGSAASSEIERLWARKATRRFFCMCRMCAPEFNEKPVTWEPSAYSNQISHREYLFDQRPKTVSEIDGELLESGFPGEGIKR